MNYQLHYEKLISRSKTREISGYTERHHIIPKCIGGSNDLENLVRLTPEEHYVAHQLLVKIYPGESKLVFAAHAMANMGKVKMREYAWLKQKRSQVLTETRSGSQNPRYGKPGTMIGKKHTGVAKRKMSTAAIGKILSIEHKQHISESHIGKFVSENTRQKLRDRVLPADHAERRTGKNNVRFGVSHTEETRQKMVKAWQNRERGQCNVCGKIILLTYLKRYHNENCKHNVRN